MINSVPRILAFAGSARRESFNKKLIRVAAQAAELAGAEVTLIDLRDFPMPIYDGDLEAEQGIPENGLKFRTLLKSHSSLLISTPEYNSSLPPLLKNTLDWASRPVGTEDGLLPYEGKLASILSASPGALGGLRSLLQLRAMLSNIGVIVLPDQLAVGRAHEAFGENGQLKNQHQQGTVTEIAVSLVQWTKRALEN